MTLVRATPIEAFSTNTFPSLASTNTISSQEHPLGFIRFNKAPEDSVWAEVNDSRCKKCFSAYDVRFAGQN